MGLNHTLQIYCLAVLLYYTMTRLKGTHRWNYTNTLHTSFEASLRSTVTSDCMP